MGKLGETQLIKNPLHGGNVFTVSYFSQISSQVLAESGLLGDDMITEDSLILLAANQWAIFITLLDINRLKMLKVETAFRAKLRSGIFKNR